MKKTISIFLAIAFFCSLAVISESRIGDGSERLTGQNQTGTGPAPRFREAEQEQEIRNPAKKFPWLLVGGIVAGAALGAFLIFSVFKKKDYDIRGTWEVSVYPLEKPRYTMNIDFKGSKTAGDYTGGSYGTYSVEGRMVRFGYATHGGGWSYSGAFDARDRISGTFTVSIWWTAPVTGTWWARKLSSDAGDK